jgi:nitrile hydratase
MAANIVERGLADADEIAAGHALRAGKTLKRKLSPELGAKGASRGSFARETNRPARFKLGDRVRARNIHPSGHTRLPRYVRDHVGEVVLVHGCHVFPDAVALAMENEDPQWLYTVRFDGRELWGLDGDPTLKVSVDAFEPYLEPA